MNPPIIVNKFDYPKLERITREDGVRHYLHDGNPLASVTTILSATSDSPELAKWRERVGEKEANRVMEEACNLGSLMHEHLENYVQNLERPRGNNFLRVLSKNMADQIINRGLPNVDEIWGMEEILYYPEAYAGTTDLVGLHNGVPAIMDYKTSKKMKSKSMIENYFCQGAAYAIAHNFKYGTDIKKIVIFMVDRNLEYKEFVVEGSEYEEYCDKWIMRLEAFLNMQRMRKISQQKGA